jgi:PTS system nitrogen regulatory IIA component
MPNSGFAGFEDLIGTGGIVCAANAADKASAIALLAQVAATATGLDAAMLRERVMLREALGSTGFGGGAAIPHARLAGLADVFVAIAVFASPVEFGAVDDQPVDIVVLLLSPEGAGADHLKALARISRTLRDPARLAAIRAASDSAGVRAALYLAEVPRQAA